MGVDADIRRRDRTKIAADGIAHAREFHPEAVGVEANQWQVMLADQVADESAAGGFMLPVWPLYNMSHKQTRIRATLTPYLSRHEIRFKRNSPGAALLVEQLRGFPSCKYDDGPDALEICVSVMRQLFDARLAEREAGVESHGQDRVTLA
jgi:predicted phage terminase large subunit-like protein